MTRARVLTLTAAAALVAIAGIVSFAVPRRSIEVSKAQPVLGSATTPTAAFDRLGRLWVAWVEESRVLVGVSTDRGATFAPPVRVTPEAEPIDANGEARPKIALGRDGEIFVSWTRTGAKPFTGDIRFAVSRDGGRTFSPPVTVNDDGLEIGHRFDSLHVNRAGHVYIAWIDKRDLEHAVAHGHSYSGAALYFTLSTDGGRTFQPNRKIKDYVCECCRLAIDFDADDKPVLVWRDVIEGSTRDHAIVRFVNPTTPAEPHRATDDGWHIDACPHHGPSLSISDDGMYHMVWFTGVGPEGPGSFYARSSDGGKTFSEPMRVSSRDTLGHAVVLSNGSRVVVAWKVSGGEEGRPVYTIESADGGGHWSDPRAVAWAKGTSDHPFLLKSGSDMFLSWHSAADGYRLIALE
jgi:hypothetical protein